MDHDPLTDIESVCNLATGKLLDWRGLHPFLADQLPSCLSSAESGGWLQFGREHAQYGVHRLGQTGPDVWLFVFSDNRVHLVEVFGLQLPNGLDTLLPQLGAPDTQLEYPLAAQLQRPLRNPNEDLTEYVYAGRGLALILGYQQDQPVRLARVRGFEVMAAQQYRSLYVELPPVRFFQE